MRGLNPGCGPAAAGRGTPRKGPWAGRPRGLLLQNYGFSINPPVPATVNMTPSGPAPPQSQAHMPPLTAGRHISPKTIHDC